jgi:hypothetical protein
MRPSAAKAHPYLHSFMYRAEARTLQRTEFSAACKVVP